MSFLKDLFGSKPDVPKLPALDIGTEQSKAIENNIKAAPAAGRLANFTQDQILGMMRKTNPYLDQTLEQTGKNIYEESKGEVPQDVQDFVRNKRIAGNFSGGYGGSGRGRNLVARDFGLTSLGIMDKAQSKAESWIESMNRMMAPATATLTSMFLTPAQQAGFDVEERNAQYQRKWLSEQIDAMPDPTTGGLVRTGLTVAGAVAGGVFGGGAGAAMGASMGSNIGNSITGSGGGSPTTFNFGGSTKSTTSPSGGFDYENMIQAMGGGAPAEYAFR